MPELEEIKVPILLLANKRDLENESEIRKEEVLQKNMFFIIKI